MAKRIRIGIDTGGTFTDFHVGGEGRGFIFKIPSTPADPAIAVLEGLRQIARALSAVGSLVIHGTTVGTNALLTRRTARTAFVTTAGFEDLLEIGRQNRESLYDLDAGLAPPLVPRSLRFGVGERTYPRSAASAARHASGDRARRVRPSRAEISRLGGRLRASGVEAVAVGFLHSYLDPRNEEAVARGLSDLGIPVTLSHTVAGEYREYERFSTAVANAALRPGVGRYLAGLERGAAPAKLAVLQSDGTTATARAASVEPVRTVLSGPAGGALAARDLAKRLGDRRVLSFDMGGTSTDAVLIDGEIPRTRLGRVGGIPLRTPMVDVRSVGAGGGSIARRDAAGALRVGPESAGADPGPACYGRGVAPTVTDAHIVLGRLGARDLLGGAFPVDSGRSTRAVRALARRLGMTTSAAAEGILRVVEATMERALRSISMEQGRDPRRFSLYAFGGAGGLHACALAERLGIARIVIPPGPGVFSATGLSSADPGVELSATIAPVPADLRRLRGTFESLEARARARLHDQGVGPGGLRIERLADMRYEGQSHEITVPFGSGMERAFLRAHRVRYGHVRPGASVEVVTLRLRATSRGRGSGLRAAARGSSPWGTGAAHGRGAPAVWARATVWSPEEHPVERGGSAERMNAPPAAREAGSSLDAPDKVSMIIGGRQVRSCVVAREAMRPGIPLAGPARITEYSATTFVAPGWTARAGPQGALVITRRKGARGRPRTDVGLRGAGRVAREGSRRGSRQDRASGRDGKRMPGRNSAAEGVRPHRSHGELP